MSKVNLLENHKQQVKRGLRSNAFIMRTKRVLYFMITSFILQILSAIAGFLISRILLSNYGSSANGLISLVNQILSYLRLVEAGLGFAAIQALYKPLVEDNWNRVNCILSTTAHFYRITAIVFSGLLGVFVLLMPFFAKDEFNPYTAALIMLVSGMGIAVEYYAGGRYTALLTANQRGYVLNIAQGIALILGTFAGVALMLVNCDLFIVRAVTAVCYLSRIVIVWAYTRIRYPNVRFDLQKDNSSISQRWSVLVHQISSMVVMNTDIIVLSIFTSLKVVSVYSIYSMVFRMPLILLQSVFESITSGVGQLLAERDKNKTREVFNDLELLSIMLVMITVTGALVVAMPFVRLFTLNIHDINYMDINIAILFAGIILMNTIRGPYLAVITAEGHFKATRSRAIAEATINLVVSLALVGVLGIYGVLIGTIVSYLYRTTDTILYSYKYILEGSSWKTWRRIGSNLLLCGFMSKYFFILTQRQSLGWSSFFVYLLFAGVSLTISVIVMNWVIERETMQKLAWRAKSLIVKNCPPPLKKVEKKRK